MPTSGRSRCCPPFAAWALRGSYCSALRRARAALELHVAEKNREAQALYESAGFARCGVDLEYYGHGQDGLRYRKVLQDA